MGVSVRRVNWELPFIFETEDVGTGVLFRFDGDVLKMYVSTTGDYWGADYKGKVGRFEFKDGAVNDLIERLVRFVREQLEKVSAYEYSYDGNGKWEYACEGSVYAVEKIAEDQYLVLSGLKICAVKESREEGVKEMIYRVVSDSVKKEIGIAGNE